MLELIRSIRPLGLHLSIRLRIERIKFLDDLIGNLSFTLIILQSGVQLLSLLHDLHRAKVIIHLNVTIALLALPLRQYHTHCPHCASASEN